MYYITDIHTLFLSLYICVPPPLQQMNRTGLCHHERFLEDSQIHSHSDINALWTSVSDECLKMSIPQWQNCITAQWEYGFYMSQILHEKHCWVVKPHLWNDVVTSLSVNAHSSPKWGDLSGLFNWSETGLSDTVVKITATLACAK